MALVVNLLATLVLLGITGRLAYTPAATRGALDRLLAYAGAASLGAVAWWLVSALYLSSLFEARPDQTAWAFSLAGLVALTHSSKHALMVSILLLSAGFWTKQNTVIAPVAAVIWMSAAAAVGVVRSDVWPPFARVSSRSTPLRSPR